MQEVYSFPRPTFFTASEALVPMRRPPMRKVFEAPVLRPEAELAKLTLFFSGGV